MQLKDTELVAHCRKNGLLPIYWVAGEDALQRQEAADAIRQQAKRSGYQRDILSITPHFSWDSFCQKIDHYDLFSDRQLIELHHPSGHFDNKAQAAIHYFFEKAPNDKSVLIISEKLNSNQKKAKFTQVVGDHGALVWLWPPNRVALPKWIETRLKAKHLTADKEAIALLAQYSEGDLSTAQQAIHKLELVCPSLPVQANVMQAVISDHANFNAFDCVDAAIGAQPKRCLRLLSGLRATHQEPTLLLWGITQQLKDLHTMRRQLDSGISINTVLKSQWEKRQDLLKSALRRYKLPLLRDCLADAFQVDLSIKGVEKNDPWQLLENLCLKLAIEA
jgi:DNA polymerase-3 subunit delta